MTGTLTLASGRNAEFDLASMVVVGQDLNLSVQQDLIAAGEHVILGSANYDVDRDADLAGAITAAKLDVAEIGRAHV